MFMKKGLIGCCLVLLAATGWAQSNDETAIRKVMADQADAWSRGSIDDFMKGYWHNGDGAVSHEGTSFSRSGGGTGNTIRW